MISSVSVEARKLVLRTRRVVQEKGILTLQVCFVMPLGRIDQVTSRSRSRVEIYERFVAAKIDSGFMRAMSFHSMPDREKLAPRKDAAEECQFYERGRNSDLPTGTGRLGGGGAGTGASGMRGQGE